MQVGDTFDPSHPDVPANGVLTFNPWELGAPCLPFAPTGGGLSSNSGPLAGGNIVTITGQDFIAPVAVLIDGVAVDAASVTLMSDTQIDVVMPVSLLPDDGNVEIEVSALGGSTAPLAYTYIGPGALSVMDESGWQATGPVGGPFTPLSKTWSLENSGADDIEVLVTTDAGGFFNISGVTLGAPFVLAAGASRDVTGTFGAAANALSPGVASGTIRFTNQTNGSGTTARAVELSVLPHSPNLVVVSSLNPSLVGDQIILSSTLTGGFAASGTVEFFVNGVSLGTEPLVGDRAEITVSDLPVGSHQITATYSGDGNNNQATSPAIDQAVNRHGTSLSLMSSLPSSIAGESISILATLTGGSAASGTVEFFANGVSLGTEPLVGDRAEITVSDLPVGSHQITATYSGDDNNESSTSAAVTQIVDAKPRLVLRVETNGVDGRFQFSSPEVLLNLSIDTYNGVGESAPVLLMPGTYRVTMADRRADGLLLSSITCPESGTAGDINTRTLQIAVDANETLVCTFVLTDVAQQTLPEIAAFLEARANVLLANMPGAQRRFARLKGQAASVSSPGSLLMSYLPVLVNGGTLSGSASLAQIEALAGNEQQARFDAWIEGTFGLYSSNGAQGRFGLVSLGADYLVTDDLLVGGFFQIDQLSQETVATAATAGGTGWMAGPYLTARLSENLYLDLMAAGGQAENRVSPFGTYEDWYGSTRFLASATLEGNWSYGAWTFAPVASASWFSETSNAYTDSFGVAIPSTSVEQAQFTAGPGVRHTQDLGGGVSLSTSVRLQAVAGYARSLLTAGQGSYHGRVSAGLDFGFEGGAALAFTLGHDGLFGTGSRSTSFNVRMSAPLN